MAITTKQQEQQDVQQQQLQRVGTRTTRRHKSNKLLAFFVVKGEARVTERERERLNCTWQRQAHFTQRHTAHTHTYVEYKLTHTHTNFLLHSTHKANFHTQRTANKTFGQKGFHLPFAWLSSHSTHSLHLSFVFLSAAYQNWLFLSCSALVSQAPLG